LLEHARRVGRTSAQLALELGWSEREADRIRRAAPLHDIGKIGLPDAILHKTGGLSAQESDTLKRHTAIGAQILVGSDSPVLTMAESIALAHHERWDGAGYPRGLSGEEIPLPARVVAVADAFDALTHQRPDKQAWRADEAVAEIVTQGGRQFDPNVVAAFSKLDHAALLAPVKERKLHGATGVPRSSAARAIHA
jgi:putative two-component system response regulator